MLASTIKKKKKKGSQMPGPTVKGPTDSYLQG